MPIDEAVDCDLHHISTILGHGHSKVTMQPCYRNKTI